MGTFLKNFKKECREMGRLEGLEQGMAKGVEKGREEERKSFSKEVAKRLLSYGESKEKVAAITDLSIDTVSQIMERDLADTTSPQQHSRSKIS